MVTALSFLPRGHIINKGTVTPTYFPPPRAWVRCSHGQGFSDKGGSPLIQSHPVNVPFSCSLMAQIRWNAPSPSPPVHPAPCMTAMQPYALEGASTCLSHLGHVGGISHAQLHEPLLRLLLSSKVLIVVIVIKPSPTFFIIIVVIIFVPPPSWGHSTRMKGSEQE